MRELAIARGQVCVCGGLSVCVCVSLCVSVSTVPSGVADALCGSPAKEPGGMDPSGGTQPEGPAPLGEKGWVRWQFVSPFVLPSRRNTQERGRLLVLA